MLGKGAKVGSGGGGGSWRGRPVICSTRSLFTSKDSQLGKLSDGEGGGRARSSSAGGIPVYSPAETFLKARPKTAAAERHDQEGLLPRCSRKYLWNDCLLLLLYSSCLKTTRQHSLSLRISLQRAFLPFFHAAQTQSDTLAARPRAFIASEMDG